MKSDSPEYFGSILWRMIVGLKGRLNEKFPSYQYSGSHFKDKTVAR